jgi:hypothetical protein
VVAELVAAVDEGRLADVADTCYALSLAAEIAERPGELTWAVELAGSDRVAVIGAQLLILWVGRGPE